MNEKIFIIEDEPDMLELLAYISTRQEFKVYKYKTGEDALNNIERLKPDLVLLDLMLPGMSGLEICKRIKDNPEISHIPVIILTSRNDEYDVLNAFNFGCSDYVTKPFSEKILIARMKACMAKHICKCKKCSEEEHIVRINKLLIDASRYEVSIKNKVIDLTPLEFKLLYFLAKNGNKVYTRTQIFIEIYEDNDYRSDRSVDILINRIRNKLGSYSNNIETVYGVGYSFKVS